MNRQRSPIQGIFAVRVFGVEDGKSIAGVASLGSRPTVEGKHCVLEVHLFDWSGDCYGMRVEVEFVKHLRNEEKFDDIAAMTLQIERDAESARKELKA